MDKTSLVETDIDIGRQALVALEQSAFEVPALLWLYMPDATEWRLVVATPLVDREGARATYARIGRILKRHDLADALPLRRVWAVSSSHDMIKLLRKVVKTGPGISNIRLTNNAINNVVIDDAYIYRMN